MKALTLAALVFILQSSPAYSDVVDSASAGFTIQIIVPIKVPPPEVYRRLIHNIGDWWSPGHTYSGSAKNLSIEEKAMGCFCEKMPDGGMVRHLQVVSFLPNKAIGFTGALGPLQNIAANGNMEIRITPADAGSSLKLTYAVTGYLPAGMNTWAKPVDAMLTEQFTRLKTYVETGNPVPK